MAVRLGQFRRNPVSFGYNAVEDRGRRQAPRTIVISEDDVLNATKRRKLQATAKDQPRNVSILAWMLRRHLDYVSRFAPHIRTGIPEIDKKVISLLKWHGHRDNFDIAGRHGRDDFMRIFEASKSIDGDVLAIKLDSGHLQGIEGDLVAKPSDLDNVPKQYQEKISQHGLVLNDQLRVEKYCLCKRQSINGTGRDFVRLIDRDDAIFDGYFSRFSQTRGISLFAPTVNMVQDMSETLEWVALKAKLHALFGLAFKRQATGGMRWNKDGYSDSTNNEDTTKNPYEVQITPRGIFTLDLDPGDDVTPIESKEPSTELLGFTREEIRMILLALDIPFTAYDSMQASFSARIADRAEYEESAADKRRKNAEVLTEYSSWKLVRWASQPEVLGDLLAKNKLSLPELQTQLEWIPAGTPWLDKQSEIRGDQLAVGMGADSTPRVARRRGLDAYQIIDEQAEFLAYAKDAGVPIYNAAPGQVSDNPASSPADDAPADNPKPAPKPKDRK